MLEIRTARENEADVVPELLYNSGKELYDYLFETKDRSALDYLKFEFRTDRGFCGYSHITVGIVDGKIAATGSFYSRKDYTNGLGSGKSVRPVFSLSG